MKVFGIICALIVVLLGLWFAFEIVREIIRLYSSADADLKLGVITAVGSAFAFVLNNAIQASRERRARLFEAKREAYAKFFASFMSFFHRFARDKDVSEQEMITAIQGLATDVMTWGSAQTINAFNKYQKENATPTDDMKKLFARTEEFLRALRNDLGHSDRSLEKFALTKLLLRGDEHEKLN